MGQSALILTLAATLTIIVILIVVGQTTRDTDSELAEYQYKVLAREAASTGLNMSVRRLVAEPHRWSDTTITFSYPMTPHGVGSFSTTVTPRGAFVETFYGWMDQDTVDVVSTGRIATAAGDTTHIIEARYVKGYYDFGLPPAFKKAVFADSVLSINGTAHIQHTDTTQNAHIHGNDEIKAVGTGNGATVEGYGTVSNDPMGVFDQIKPSADAIFDPNDPVEGAELVGPDFPIYLPPIDASAIHDQAETDGVPHHHVLTSDMTPPKGSETRYSYDLNNVTIRPSDYACFASGCGTYGNPMLFYVPGNLNVNNIVVEGYVQFVVEGDIDFQGSSVGFVDTNNDGIADPEPPEDTPEWDAWIDAQLDAADNTTIGYYSEGDVTVGGNFTLVGQIYANGDITLGGGGGNDVNIIGGVTSSESNVTINGGVTIRFAMMSNTTLLPGMNYIVPEGVRLIAYAEW